MTLQTTLNEAIEPDLLATEVRQEGYSLPTGFNWVNVNMNDVDEVRDLTDF